MIYIAGKNNIAVSALEYLYSNYGKQELKVICNKTDNGHDSWQRSLKKRARELDIKIEELNNIKLNQDDIFISLEFDKIVKELGSQNVFNIHFSNLPKYKGMYTSVHPILNNEKESGVTLHEIDNGIDTGNIIDQIIFPLEDEIRAHDLYRKYIMNSTSLFLKNIDSIIHKKIVSTKQKAQDSSYFSKGSIDFRNININFNQTAWSIKKFIYAFTFRVYQLVSYNGKSIASVKILDEKSHAKPGKIINETENYIDVATIDYDIRLFFDNLDNVLMRFSTADSKNMEIMLSQLCGIHDRNEYGWSPIIVAAYNGNIDIIEKLINLGADINDVNYKGTSVLMYAKNFCIKTKSRELFDYLISLGADITHRDFKGKSLHDYLSLSESKILGV
jgi:similarities with formyltransferase